MMTVNAVPYQVKMPQRGEQRVVYEVSASVCQWSKAGGGWWTRTAKERELLSRLYVFAPSTRWRKSPATRGYCAIRKSLSACSSLWVVAMDGSGNRTTLPRGEMRAGRRILWASNIAPDKYWTNWSRARLFICSLFSLFFINAPWLSGGRVDGVRALIASLGESAFLCALLAPWSRKLTFSSSACTFFFVSTERGSRERARILFSIQAY